VSFAHYNVVVTTHVGTSSLWHLHSILHAINFVSILVVASRIHFIIIPREPLFVPYVLFISYVRAFSLVLSSRYCARLSPFDDKPVMNAINSMLMETSSSNYKKDPWRTTINRLTHMFTSFPLLKWGISTKFRIHVFSRTVAHCFGCSIGSPNGHVPRLSMYTCCENSGNLLVSATSWSAYLILSMQPNRFGVACTPSRMRGKTSEASGCLRGDHMMGCFPFLFTGDLEVQASGFLSSLPNSRFPMMS
jgi:hypothetical protein